MANKNYNPNARFDSGKNAAGCGRASIQSVLAGGSTKGLAADGTVVNADMSVGQNVAGGVKNNTGPNVAGAPRSYNGV